MIHYKYGRYGLGLVFRVHGSVFPKAAVVAVPPTLIAVAMRVLFPEFSERFASDDIGRLYNTFIWVLGIVLVFRTSQAYARYWEGAQLIESVYSDFFDSCACVINFSETCTTKSRAEINAFQSIIVGLFSLMHCCALQQVTVREDDSFEVIDMEGMDQAFLDDHYAELGIEGRRQKTEVVSQWILRLVLESIESGLIPTPPPIVSRVFQEIHAGVLAANRMSTITYTPFPFPYAQLITMLLSFTWVLTPAYLGTLSIHPGSAGAFVFLSVFVLWSLNLIAAEIEQPFGDDYNDFDIHNTQKEMNSSLLKLLGKQFRALPPHTPCRPSGVKPLHRAFTKSSKNSSMHSSSSVEGRSSPESDTTQPNLRDQDYQTEDFSQSRLDHQSHNLVSQSELDLNESLAQAVQVAKESASRSEANSKPGGSGQSSPFARKLGKHSDSASQLIGATFAAKSGILTPEITTLFQDLNRNQDRVEARLRELCLELRVICQNVSQLSEYIQKPYFHPSERSQQEHAAQHGNNSSWVPALCAGERESSGDRVQSLIPEQDASWV
eukprot:gnl/MRDRNA2_/MRDRNA2_24580_c0_seq2.p1 gnl/MRDRNA2_/MRDRNA2_24580_c0~~gnl/MRDRNA2_/MRDRNA2_24580_c0_seq2.p1  ORF type:complete len:551 (+),score=47.13 gnl/MRDRNA2_/MRDRNA2_24580_c0_seq2:100-1752(+)